MRSATPWATSTRTCTALAALNHDDDVLWLELYERGNLTASHQSGSPAYCRIGDSHGGASRLCRAFGNWLATPLVAILLRVPFVPFEIHRHAALAWFLGLPTWMVGTGYNYIDAGEMPEGLSRDQLEHT
jgi:hypothetical protein